MKKFSNKVVLCLAFIFLLALQTSDIFARLELSQGISTCECGETHEPAALVQASPTEAAPSTSPARKFIARARHHIARFKHHADVALDYKKQASINASNAVINKGIIALKFQALAVKCTAKALTHEVRTRKHFVRSMDYKAALDRTIIHSKASDQSIN